MWDQGQWQGRGAGRWQEQCWDQKQEQWILTILSEREKDGQSASGGGAEREGDTESKVGSRLRAVSIEPDVGLEPTNH